MDFGGMFHQVGDNYKQCEVGHRFDPTQQQ